MSTENPGIDRERELELLLAKANLHRLRGQPLEAQDTCRRALELNPKDVLIREMLGDSLYDAGKLQAALAEYRTALDYAPGKDSLEKKFARTTLDIAEAERAKVMAQDMLQNPGKYQVTRERSQVVAFVSALVPGLGQLYNGELTKAALIFGTFVIFLLSWAFLQPPYPRNVNTLQMFVYVTSPAVLVTGVVFFLAYIYGLADALVTAGKTTKKPAPAPEPPKLEPPV